MASWQVPSRTPGGTKVAFVRENKGDYPCGPIPEREAGGRDP
jgi:hypothetical protein